MEPVKKDLFGSTFIESSSFQRVSDSQGFRPRWPQARGFAAPGGGRAPQARVRERDGNQPHSQIDSLNKTNIIIT
jgi:hypothetical protein